LLSARVLGWDRTRLVTSWRDPAPSNFPDAFERLVARREGREPISQILGVREFWGLEFEVTRDVLTPRPETEGIVEVIKEHFGTGALLEGSAIPIIEDVGTGSGCLAIALAKELPRARFIALDVSEPALDVARRNARRHGVSHHIAFVQGNVFATETDVDAIVSNPPYVPTGDRDSLPPEVRVYEPPDALFAGTDGLAVITELITGASRGLSRSGMLVFECGAGQAPAIREMMTRAPWLELVEIRPDLAGIPRIVVATKKP
jgi:release factor glutamine methyltransferase